VIHVSLRDLFASERARVVPNASGPASDDAHDPASVILAGLADSEREAVLDRAAHVREVLSGYRSGSPELAGVGEPRAQFATQEPLTKRYEAKAAELGVSMRNIQQWVADFHDDGEAGLARRAIRRKKPLGMVDDRLSSTLAGRVVRLAGRGRAARAGPSRLRRCSSWCW
jgi:hypothetical protein